MSRARDWVVSVVVLTLGRGQPKPRIRRRRIVERGTPERRAETAALVLLGLGSLLAVVFVVIYALDRLPRQTQLLGLALGLSLAAIAAACIVMAKRLVVTEELEEDYPIPEHPEEQEQVEQILAESGDRLTRRRLFKLGLGAAGGSLGVALVTPVLSLGPVIDTAPFYGTPWRRGRRLVDDGGKPWRAADIEQDNIYTAYPEGADKEELGSPLVLVRLPTGQLRLPGDRRGWDAGGIVAYSKICTHAGCAISLYRAPLFQPDEPRPALVCPCHYSTFDPATGGNVLFGPAGRPLPQLPLVVDRKGTLRAGGNFNQPVGPSWWGVRLRRPNP
ncbi:MAG: ubiquinol-cytochrome c reductase iron-sulfur subunit [Gaiellaceae bacterium]